MSKLLFGIAILIAARGSVVRADDQSDATAILDAAIKAHGGEAALGKVAGLYFKMKGTAYKNGAKSPISLEVYYGNDGMRSVTFDEDNKVTGIEVFNGKDGWRKDGDQATEKLNDAQVKADQEFIYQNWATMFVPLRAKEYRLSVLEDSDVAGHKAIGILVRNDKHDPLKLYFDKESHLLAKLQCKFRDVDAGKEYDQEIVYSDYRDVQDTKQPFKFVQSWDGAKVSDCDISEVKLYDKPLDEKLFVKP